MRKIYDAFYTTSDLVRAQKGNLILYGLKRKAEGLPLNKEVYDADPLHVINQFWNKFQKRFLMKDQDNLIYKRTDEKKVSYPYDAIILPQLYQAEATFRAHDQCAHQGLIMSMRWCSNAFCGLACIVPLGSG